MHITQPFPASSSRNVGLSHGVSPVGAINLLFYYVYIRCLEVGEEVHEVHIQKDQEQPPTSAKFATFLYGGVVSAIWFFCC